MIGSLTVFTTSKPAHLGKLFSLKDGQLVKGVAGNMYEGSYEVRTFDSREGLADLLKTIGTDQAICASLPRTEATTGRLLTIEKAAAAGCLARTKVDFPFKATPGILTLDYDPPKEELALSRDELWTRLIRVCPAADNAGAVWWSSGSSHIHGPEGELQGLRGQRLYLLIQDASDIERAGKVLADQCWLHGLGRVDISKSGSKLLRTLWDEAMHQPARLDFIGGAVCDAPVFQQRTSPTLMGGDGWLDTKTALPELTDAQVARLKGIQTDAQDKVQPESEAQRQKWIDRRASEEGNRLHKEDKLPLPDAMQQGRRIAESALSGTLYGSYRIPLTGGKYVTVADVLDNWQEWDKKKTLDPLEPDHRNFEECGILYLTGTEQKLYSFAHGGITFRLARQPTRVLYRKGRQSPIADELAQALSAQGDIFLSGEAELMQALPGRMKPLDRHDAQYLLGHRVILVVRKDGHDVPMNIPAELVNNTFSAMGQKPNQTPPRLISVTRLPYATANRRIVTQPGFDAETGIYNLMEQNECLPVGPTTRAALIEALRTLWRPWANYKFASDADRAAMFAAIFTAVLRPAMTTAPGIFFDAPVQGSGKTKAALALGALMTGDHVGVHPYVEGRNQEEETSKALVATLRSDRRFWLIDNVTGRFDSAVLAGMITSGRVQGRILGMSKDGDFSARVMLCATGNNATLGSDLSRRFLLCRIDTGVERPTDVPHSFEPAQVAKDSRMQIASAVLTVLKAYWEAHPVTVTGGADFHEWSKLVREPLIWLQEQGLTEAAGIGRIEDPAKALGHGTTASNPEQIGLQQLLDGLEVRAGINKPFYARDVHIWYLEGEHRVGEAEGLIRDGIDNLTGGKMQTPRSLAHVLLNRRDRRVCGKRLANVGTDRDGVIWHVRAD